MNLRESRWWDKTLEGGLPDSRLTVQPHLRKTELKITPFGPQLMEQCFCANCGKQDGWTTVDVIPHVFYLCDACAPVHGAGLLEVPVPHMKE